MNRRIEMTAPRRVSYLKKTKPISYDVPTLCQDYQWPSGLEGGGVIAIVEMGGGWVQSDIDAYFSSIGQPSPAITDISADGQTNNNPNQSIGQQSDPDYEVTMDIQIAGASYYVATGKPATIRMYWTQDIALAVQKATADECDVCSISWGSDEANWGDDGGNGCRNGCICCCR
jgi:kumamolisin